MLLSQELTEGVVVLAVAGPVAVQDAPALQSAVERAAEDGVRGVVVDLAHAGPLAAAAVDVLSRSAREAVRPRPALAVCCAPADLVALLLPEVRLHRCREDALAHVDGRPQEPAGVRVTVTCGPEGPGEARRLALECAQTHGFAGDDLALVVTELVTNAVRHGSPPVEVEIDTCGHCVTVVVADGSSVRPVRRAAGDGDEGGRGLLLVDLLAAEQGVRPSGSGKAVWAELPRHEALPGG